MHERGALGHPGLGVGHGGQRRVLDLDERDRVLGDVAGLGGDHGHGLAEVAHLLDRDRVLHHLLGAEPGERADDARGTPGRSARRARPEGPSPPCVDRDDPGVRVRRAQHRGVQHAGQPQVVDVRDRPAHQRRVLLAGRSAPTHAVLCWAVVLMTGLARPHRSRRRCAGSPCSGRCCPPARPRISASDGFAFRSSSSTVVARKPGVQNPHCWACASGRPAARGARRSPVAMPSTVTTSAPSACTASIRHERALAPSTSTVHEPHTPCPHPTLVPVSPRSSRSRSTSSLRGSTPTRCSDAVDGQLDDREIGVGVHVAPPARRTASASARRTATRPRLRRRRATRARHPGCVEVGHGGSATRRSPRPRAPGRPRPPRPPRRARRWARAQQADPHPGDPAALVQLDDRARARQAPAPRRRDTS